MHRELRVLAGELWLMQWEQWLMLALECFLGSSGELSLVHMDLGKRLGNLQKTWGSYYRMRGLVLRCLVDRLFMVNTRDLSCFYFVSGFLLSTLNL